jgi:hypothetical protein
MTEEPVGEGMYVTVHENKYYISRAAAVELLDFLGYCDLGVLDIMGDADTRGSDVSITVSNDCCEMRLGVPVSKKLDFLTMCGLEHEIPMATLEKDTIIISYPSFPTWSYDSSGNLVLR